MTAATILIVEPNPGILIVARNVLTRAGHAVLAVGRVDEGLTVARGARVDAILVDVRQADPDVLAALLRPRRIPVVLTFERGKSVGGDHDLDETQPGVAAAGFLEKPFAPERLLDTIERVIERWRDNTPTFGPPTREAPVPFALGPDEEAPILLSEVVEPADAVFRPGEASASSRGDTLVSVRITGDDDFADNDKTDIFPFAHLVEPATRRPRERARGAAHDARAGVLAEHLRTFLEVEGITPRPALLSACLRACSAVLESSADTPTVTPFDRAEPAIEGVVPELSIDQVLQLAMAVGQPARCRVSDGSMSIELFYEGGSVVFARHRGLPDGFLLGQLLTAAGAVRESQVMAALNQAQDGTRLGERLLARGELLESELAAALRGQTEELTYEVVRWSTARFAIFAHEPVPPAAQAARQALAVPHLLLEGMRRLDEWRRMQPRVGDLDAVVDRFEPASKIAHDVLSAEEREVFRHVDGRRTVAELVRLVGRPTFHVYRALHALFERRLVNRISG